MRIFRPIRNKMTPPKMVAFLPILAPILRPLSIPTSEARAVKIKVKSVTKSTRISERSTKARLTPTATASMLVAMPISNRHVKSIQHGFCLLGLQASVINFSPR